MAERSSEAAAAAAAEAEKPTAEEKQPEIKDNPTTPKTEAKTTGNTIPAEFRDDPEVQALHKELHIEKTRLELDKAKKEREVFNKEKEVPPEPVETDKAKVADQVAEAVVVEAHEHAEEIAQAAAPNEDEATRKRIVDSIHTDLDKPGVFRRVGNFFKENGAAIAGGFTAGGIKVGARIATGILISPTWWAAMGVGAGAGAIVEAGRDILKQSKKLESLDAAIREMESEKDLVKKAAILNRLEKLQKEARIKQDEPEFGRMSAILHEAKLNLMAEVGRDKGEIPTENLQQLSYILKLSRNARKETPKTLRKETERMLKQLEKEWSYQRGSERAKDLFTGKKNWRNVARAALRGGVVGATAGLFGWGVAEYALPAAEAGFENAQAAASEVVRQKTETLVQAKLDTVQMHGTVWDTVKGILEQNGVHTNDAIVNEATRMVAAANDVAIHADHLSGEALHNYLDVHMQEGTPLYVGMLNDFIASHGGHLGTEIVTKTTEVGVESKTTIAAERAANGFYNWMVASIAAGIAEEIALRKMKRGSIDYAQIKNTDGVRPEVADRIKELNRQDGEKYLTQLDSQLRSEISRDVNLNIVATHLTHEDLSNKEIQSKIGEVVSLLKEPEFATKLGGFDIVFTKADKVTRLPYVRGQRPCVLIPVELGVNEIREQLEEVVRPLDLDQLEAMHQEAGRTKMQIDISDKKILSNIYESGRHNEYNEDLNDIDDLISRLDPALVKKIGTLTFGGTTFNARFPKRNPAKLEIPFPFGKIEDVVAQIEDAAAAQGVKFERSAEVINPSDLRNSAEQLSQTFEQLSKQGNNEQMFAKLEKFIVSSSNMVYESQILAEENLKEVVHDSEAGEFYVPPVIKKMYRIKLEQGKINRLINTMEAVPGGKFTEAQAQEMRAARFKINDLLAEGSENKGVIRERIANDLIEYRNRHNDAIKNLRGKEVKVQTIKAEELDKWSLRKQQVFFNKVYHFGEALLDPKNQAVLDSLKQKNIILDPEMGDNAELSQDKKTYKINTNISVDEMIDALQYPKEIAGSEPKNKTPLSYLRRREELERDYGISVIDTVLLEEINDLEKQSDRTKKYNEFKELYTLIARDNELRTSLSKRFLSLDNAPTGNNKISVNKNTIHISIKNNLNSRQAYNALKAELNPPVTPAGGGGRGRGRRRP